MTEFFGILIVPIAFILLKLCQVILKKINIFFWMTPITTYAIHYIFNYIFKYSPLSYLGLIYTILGIFLLFYSFRRNRVYTFIKFFKRVTVMYSKVTLLLWFIMSTYQIISYIIV